MNEPLRMTTITPALQALMDRGAIVQATQNWGFFRDDRQWEKLRDLYTADGRMTTTWTVATADEFVHHCRELASKGGGRKTIHSIGATITPDLPVPNSESLKKLYAAGSAWLAAK